MVLFELKQTENSPARVTQTLSTVADHIYTNNDLAIYDVGVPITSMDDPFPVCCIWKAEILLKKVGVHKKNNVSANAKL